MAGLALLVAAALAAQDAPLGWVCARNFVFGDAAGLISQDITPAGARFPIQFLLWRIPGPARQLRLEWQHLRSAGPDPGPPDRLEWGVSLRVSGDQPLWARFWADGLYAGQRLFATRAMLAQMRDLDFQVDTLDSVNDRATLERLMQGTRWEVEIVSQDGASLGREPIPAPTPAAIRAAFAEQSAWLAGAVERMSRPDCHPIEADQEFEAHFVDRGGRAITPR
jgi:hypothetical protein